MSDSKTSVEVFDFPAAPLMKQQRAYETRKHLVDSARSIFARDGFDLARLEDIAALAGKTRGAFYAHFRDKEDVFFAIFEEDMARDQERIRQPLSTATSREQRAEILVQHLASLIQDRRRILLTLEFKGYVIRHPRRKKRLSDLISAMCFCCAETRIDYLIPELRQSDLAAQQKQAAQFGALIDGVALNHLFDPENLDTDQVLHLLRTGVAAILDFPKSETSSEI